MTSPEVDSSKVELDWAPEEALRKVVAHGCSLEVRGLTRLNAPARVS